MMVKKNLKIILLSLSFLLIASCIETTKNDSSAESYPSPNPIPPVEVPYSWEELPTTNVFPPRDSAGEVYFNGKIFILGGWYNSSFPNLVDSYSTVDGKNFVLESDNNPFVNSDLAVSLTFKNQIFMISGWAGGRMPNSHATNDIYTSSDGKNFNYVGAAAFSPRVGATGVVFNNKIFIMGGNEEYFYGDANTLKSDVWSSSDGITWELETNNPGFSPRAFAQSFVLNNKLCITGGGNYSPYAFALNDIWCSADGKNFEMVTANAPWPARIWFSVITHNNHVWILGGDKIVPRSIKLNDIWISSDLQEWTEVKFDKIWSPRHEHSTVVANDEIFVMAGHADPINSQVWKFKIPEDFYTKLFNNKL